MKFAKELDKELVPEWRVKYLNYKAGKKRIQAVERVLRSVTPSPQLAVGLARWRLSSSSAGPSVSALASPAINVVSASQSPVSLPARAVDEPLDPTSPQLKGPGVGVAFQRTPTISLPREQQREQQQQQRQPEENEQQQQEEEEQEHQRQHEEEKEQQQQRQPEEKEQQQQRQPEEKEQQQQRQPEEKEQQQQPQHASPPSGAAAVSPTASLPKRPAPPHPRLYSFSLPAPAMRHSADWPSQNTPKSTSDASTNPFNEPLARDHFYGPSQRQHLQQDGSPLPGLLQTSITVDRRPSVATPRSTVKDSLARTQSRNKARGSLQVDPMERLQARQREFSDFLQAELAKIDDFYRQKEKQAGERLSLLRSQLHEMHSRRAREIADRKLSHRPGGPAAPGAKVQGRENAGIYNSPRGSLWVSPIIDRFRFAPGPNSMSLLHQVVTRSDIKTPGNDDAAAAAFEGQRDYARRRSPQEQEQDHYDDDDDDHNYNHDDDDDDHVPYRIAKRKLKLALQEFHRSLEMLKSYALLNRTAFRKLNKKYIKAIGMRPLSADSVNKNVDGAYFVMSDVVDGHLRTVEDLYARYLERGNRKVAVQKLRKSDPSRPRDNDGTSDGMFASGLMAGTGLVFAVQGLVLGIRLMTDGTDVALAQQVSYLLQLYAGYFLGVLLVALFCVNCRTWTANRVNYRFIFEFNPRDQLDWRELFAFPSFFIMLLGLFMWLNFGRYGVSDMFLWYPVVLVGLTVAVLFFPAPVLLHRSRRWLAVSHWRLLLSGLYPVEFRDFFLGDMYCSLAYAIANVELFFCLYSRDFDDADMCNSSHSRVMGFLTVLPPIWRFLQCIRRYKDTRNMFPHLANCGKYAATILTGVALSFYRIDRSRVSMACYLTIAILNSVYTSVWDLFMDFSLVQPNSRHRWLRDIVAIKQRWIYYTVLVVDPVLRFGWIPYVAAANELQHSSLVSFCVALAEVFRRGLWALFRVENEHCANVAQYKASRDVPLPYRLELFVPRAESNDKEKQAQDHLAVHSTIGRDAPSPVSRSGGVSPQPARPSPVPVSHARTISIAARSIIGTPLGDNDNDNVKINDNDNANDDNPRQPSDRVIADGNTPQTQPQTQDSPAGASIGNTPMRRRGLSFQHTRNISRIMAQAHTQDFQKRRRSVFDDEPVAGGSGGSENDDDDDREDVHLESESESGNGGPAGSGKKS